MALYVSSSAKGFQLNAEVLGGIGAGEHGQFMGLPGGTTGSLATALNDNINNRNIITALNSVYDAASGNEPAGDTESVQFNADGSSFGGDASLIFDVSAGALTVNASSGSMGGHLLGFSGSLVLDDGAVFSVDNAGQLVAESLKTDGDEFVVTDAGAVSAASLAVDNGSTIGTDSDTDMLTLTNASDVTVASDLQLRFRDSGLHIQSLEDGHLGITADKAISLSGTVRANGDLVIGSDLGLTGSIAGATTIGASGLASVGSLAVDDGSTIGTDSDTDMLTLTNASDITVASDLQLRFRDSGLHIQSLEDGHLGITADKAISLSGTVRANGDLVIGSDLGLTGSIAGATTIAASGLASLGSLAVDDGSTIGTDSDTDMLTLTNASDITVASDLQLRFRDSGLHIQSLEDGHLGITADKAISLSGTVRANGDLVIGSDFGLSGSIAGATSIDGSGDLTMGSITMTGFAVDASGDSTANSLSTTTSLSVGTNATIGGLASVEGGIISSVLGNSGEALSLSGTVAAGVPVGTVLTDVQKAQIPTMAMQGTDAAGALRVFQVAVSGGMLVVNQTA